LFVAYKIRYKTKKIKLEDVDLTQHR